MAKSISPARMARAAVPTASSHARHVAVVLAGLIGAAVKHFVELFPVDLGVARHQRLDRHRGEIVGAHFRQRAAIAPDRRAHRVAEEDVTHA
jgi:hypothetical protein